MIRRRRLERRVWRPRQGVLVLIALISAPFVPRIAHADPAIVLELSAPASCPDRDAIVSAVEKLVQQAPEEPLRASARLEQQLGGYRLELTLGDGQRVVEGTSCVELSQTLAVILALAVDPKAKTDASVAFPNASGGSAETAVRDTGPILVEPSGERPRSVSSPTFARPSELDGLAPVAPEAVPNVSAASAPPRFGASLLALGDTSMLPAPALGATLIVRARVRLFVAELAGSILAPRWAQAPAARTRKGGDVWWFGGHAGGCWYPSSSVALGACLAVEAGQLIGEGDGVETARTARAFWLAAVPGAALVLPLSARFDLDARLGLAIPAFRPEFGLDGLGEFYEPGVVSGRAALGIAFE
jgi:hypothetical protein